MAKKEEVISILYSFTPFDMNLQNDFDAQSDLGKFFVTEKLGTILILK